MSWGKCNVNIIMLSLPSQLHCRVSWNIKKWNLHTFLMYNYTFWMFIITVFVINLMRWSIRERERGEKIQQMSRQEVIIPVTKLSWLLVQSNLHLIFRWGASGGISEEPVATLPFHNSFSHFKWYINSPWKGPWPNIIYVIFQSQSLIVSINRIYPAGLSMML